MPEPSTRAQDTVSLDSSPTMAMTTLYSAAVGPIGNDYYLPLFSRFEAAGRATLSWNLSACLYSINWMIFRRLWGPALVFAGVMFGASVLLVALGLLVFEWPHDVIYQSLLACLGLGMLACGLWGNALFYNRCRRAMMSAVADNKTLVQACAQLSQQSATRRRFIRLLLANALLLTLVGLASWRLWALNSADTPAPGPVPALAISAAEHAASAAGQVASAAAGPASAVSAPLQTSGLAATSAATAASAAAAASAPVSPAAMPASAPAAAPASAPASVPTAINLPVISSALATAPASTPTAAQPAATAVSHAFAPAPAPAHASAPTHTTAKPAARLTPKPTAHAASKPTAHAAAKPASKPATKVATVKAPKTIPAKAPQAAKTAPAKGIYINAGLFANPDNAHNALAKLQAAGLPATAQELETSQGTRTRIRVGPIAKPAQAEANIQKIKALGLDAALVKP